MESRGLSLAALSGLEMEPLHVARNWSKADVFLAQWPVGSGRRVVIKDLRRRPLWFRLMLGRALFGREWKALLALRDLPGVPDAIARPHADVLVTDYRPGRKVCEYADDSVPGQVVAAVAQLVSQIHQRGVVHGDLHMANIVVGDDGLVTLIDWATACVFGRSPRGWKAYSWNELRGLDRRAVAKLKVLHAPALLAPDEHDLILHGSSLVYRVVKRLWGYRRIVLRQSRPAPVAPVVRKYQEIMKNRGE